MTDYPGLTVICFFALNPFNGGLIEAAATITIGTIGNISYPELRLLLFKKMERNYFSMNPTFFTLHLTGAFQIVVSF
jgi:hypothetical protein